MATLIGICGYEHQASVPAATLASGGTLTPVTSPIRAASASQYAMRFQAASPNGVATHLFPDGQTSGVGAASLKVYKFYIYINATLGDTSVARQARIWEMDGVFASAEVVLKQAITTGALSIVTNWVRGTSTATATFSGVNVGQWYRVDMKYDCTLTTSYKLDWRMDGVAQTQSTVTPTSAAAGTPNCDVGMVGGDGGAWGGTTATADVIFDDIFCSATSADYPISTDTIVGCGASGVTAVGAHNLDASPSLYFSKTGAVALLSTDTTSYQEIDETPVDTATDFVKIAPKPNVISRIDARSAAAATVAALTRSAGDLIVVFAYRNTSATAPSLATGFTNLNTASTSGGSAHSARVAYRIADGTATDLGSFTNATDVVFLVYRNAASPVAADLVMSSQAASTIINYPAKTVSDHVNSWLVACCGASATGAITAPSGLTNETNVNASPSVGGHDSNAIRSTDWASTNVTVASQFCVTAVLEVKASITEPTNTWYLEYVLAQPVSVNPEAVQVSFAQKNPVLNVGGNSLTVKISDDSFSHSTDTVLSPSSTFINQYYPCMNTKPSTGAWTLVAAQSLKFRWGFTNSVPDGVELHSAYVEVAGTKSTPKSLISNTKERRYLTHRHNSMDRW